MPVKAANPLGALADPVDTFKNPAQAGFIRRMQEVISTALIDRPGRNSATSGVLLTSPNGTPYLITVSDAGAISATLATR